MGMIVPRRPRGQSTIVTEIDMRNTCKYVENMSKMIQIRNVPDELHRKLKARAALEGKSLSEYLLEEVRRSAERPTLTEMMERLARRTPVRTSISAASVVRQARDSR